MEEKASVSESEETEQVNSVDEKGTLEEKQGAEETESIDNVEKNRDVGEKTKV